MWVWRGPWGCLMDMAESKKILFLCFPKAKAQQEKIAINFLKKSSQVNIFILDFYLFFLLELSNYKQTKQKTENWWLVCPQIEKKVQEPSSQLSWNFPRIQYSAYKSSYVDKCFHIHKIPNWKQGRPDAFRDLRRKLTWDFSYI